MGLAAFNLELIITPANPAEAPLIKKAKNFVDFEGIPTKLAEFSFPPTAVSYTHLTLPTNREV